MGCHFNARDLGAHFCLAGVMGGLGVVAGFFHGGRIGSGSYLGHNGRHIVSIFA